MLYTNYYGCCRLFQTTIKNCKVSHLKSTDLNRIRVTQNRRQKVFNRGALHFCVGTWHSKNWQNLNWLIAFRVSIWGAKTPRGDGTGVTTLTCCNIQVKQYYTILATATGNYDVINVTNNENTCYVVTWTVYLESSMYLCRRQWLRQIVVMCRIACWFRSGAV